MAQEPTIKFNGRMVELPPVQTSPEPHPMQPIYRAEDGVIRFRENGILRFLVDAGVIDMNSVAELAWSFQTRFTAEDRMQLAQLIGYSVSGYGELSYASEGSVAAADALAEQFPDKAA